MIRINLSPTAKKGRVSKVKGAKATPIGIRLPSVQVAVIYVIGVIITVAIIGITVFIQTSKLNSLKSDVNQLSTKLNELKIYKATVDSLENREKQLADLLKPIMELNKSRFFITHIMDEIASRIPEFTWLISLDVDQTNIKLKGITASNLLVADFMNRLEESPYIHNVDLTVLEKKAIEKQEMMDFALTADLGYESGAGR